jgi:hypothetical protein
VQSIVKKRRTTMVGFQETAVPIEEGGGGSAAPGGSLGAVLGFVTEFNENVQMKTKTGRR